MLKNLYKEIQEKMDKSINMLKKELATIRTGRASPSLVENIKVNAYGESLPLKQVASISCPETRLIIIKPWDPSLIVEIEKAILRSGVGLNPTNDGVAIKLNIPQLTEERRRDLVKMVHKITEDIRIAVRNIRRDGIEKIKEIEGISEDDEFIGKKEIQKITDEYMKKIDEILKLKEKEIMEE